MIVMTNKFVAFGLIFALLCAVVISGCVSNTPAATTVPAQCTTINQTDGVLLKCTGDNVHVRVGNREFNYMYPILIWYFLFNTNQVNVYNTYTGSPVPISMYQGNSLNMPAEYYSNPNTDYGWDAAKDYYRPYESTGGYDAAIPGYGSSGSSNLNDNTYDYGNGYGSGGWDSIGSDDYDYGGWDSGGWDSYDSGGYDSGGWDSGGSSYDSGGWD